MKDFRVRSLTYYSIQALSVSLLVVYPSLLSANDIGNVAQVAMKGYHQCLPWSDDPPDEDPLHAGNCPDRSLESSLFQLFDDIRMHNHEIPIDETLNSPLDGTSCDLRISTPEDFDPKSVNCMRSLCVVLEPDSQQLAESGWVLVDVSAEQYNLLRAIANRHVH